MHFDRVQGALFGDIAEALQAQLPSGELRNRVGTALMDLLGAEYFASYVWDYAVGAYDSGVSKGMDPANLLRYEQYYQFHDPLTPAMARYHQHAKDVHEVLPRTELINTEFYNDFLAVDGLYYGLNFFGYAGGKQVGDLRIWRTKSRGPFGRTERALLEIIGKSLCTQLSVRPEVTAELPSVIGTVLTPRERQITVAVLRGLDDAEISEQFGISYATVRTHLSHVFGKLHVSSRMGLIAAVRKAENQQIR